MPCAVPCMVVIVINMVVFTNIDQITQTVHNSNVSGRLGGVVLAVCTCNRVVKYILSNLTNVSEHCSRESAVISTSVTKVSTVFRSSE